MMSCQVSLKPNTGPEAPQRTNAAKAMVNAAGRPTAREAHLANRVKMEGFFVTLIMMYEGAHPGIGPASKCACFTDVSDQLRGPVLLDLRAASKKALPKSSLRTRRLRHTIPFV